MSLVYIILAHRYPRQLLRLVERLDTAQATFVVHVDRRSPSDVFQRIQATLANRKNVELLERRACYWGGFGVVEATLDAIYRLVRSEKAFDYAVLLSGQDYPLRPAVEIESFFAGAEGHSFMEHRPASGRFVDRIERRHWHGELAGIRFKLPNRYMPLTWRRRMPLGLDPFVGSAYWSLSRPCVEHVSRFARENPDVVRFFRHSSSPDEALFHTIVMNSPLAPSVVNDSLHHVDWSEGQASPRTLTREDLPILLESDALFARKFAAEEDARLLEELDQRAGASPASSSA